MREIIGPIDELLNPANYEGTNLDDYIKVVITNEEPVFDLYERHGIVTLELSARTLHFGKQFFPIDVEKFT